MDTKSKEAKVESYPILGWILAIVGILLMVLGVWWAIYIIIHATQNVVTGLLILSVPFLAIGATLLILGIKWKNRKDRQIPTILLGCGGMIVFIVSGIIFVALVNSISKESPPQNSFVSITSSPQLSATLGLTLTPRPTITPRPTKIPGVLECRDIISTHEGMTDMQWEEYKQSIQGKQIYFSGVVSQVHDDGSVFMGEDCGITLYRVPHDIAIALNKGQLLEGYGTIQNVSYFLLGVLIDININPDLLIVR
jgi:hypothetical protein